MIFLFFVLIAIGIPPLFSILYPEADEKFCHKAYKIIMGGEDFD